MKMIDDKQFNEIYEIMEGSFPESEIRTYAGQRALLSNPNYRLITETDAEGKIIAFLASWEFSSFGFVEHFAVSSLLRGSGLGAKLLSQYIEQSQIPIRLEVELPEGEFAKRRIGFYERCGFHLNSYDYVQPPLREGQADLPLNIMSYPDPLAEAEFIHFRETVYTEVYKRVK